MSEETQVDRKDLKVLAYKERLSECLEREADLRVEVTFLSHQLADIQRQLDEYRQDTEDPDVSSDED